MTPPDIFSQTMLAIPVWLLFEAGLYFSRSIKPQSRDAEVESDDDDTDLDNELDDGIAEFEELGTDKDTPRS